MSSSTLLEMFGHVVFSFTRGVGEHYNPDEPEFTPEIFGYNGRDPFNQNFRKFRSKTQWIGSVQPEKFRKNGSTF